jgi:hypothetical protein
LDEELEHVGEHVLRDTRAVVFDAQGYLATLAFGGEQHVAAHWRVFRGVAQQICLNLQQTRGIAVDEQRLRVNLDG